MNRQGRQGRQDGMAIRSPFAPALLRTYRAAGHDAAALCQRLALPAAGIDEKEIELSVPSLRELADVVAEAVGDPFIGLNLARAHQTGTYGILELIGTNAPTLGESLSRLARYIRLINRLATFAVEVRG